MRRSVITACFILAVFSSSAFAQDSVSFYVTKGGKAMIHNDYAAAKEAFLAALRLDQNNFISIKNLGVVFSALGDQQQAKAYFERAYKLNNADPQICNNLAVMASNAGNSADAIKYYEQSLKLDTGNVLYMTNLGQEYAKVGRVSQAIELLDRAVTRDPKEYHRGIQPR